MGKPLERLPDLSPVPSPSKTAGSTTTTSSTNNQEQGKTAVVSEDQQKAQCLVAIERELGAIAASPSETAVIHRVIAATGDLELGQALQFSSDAVKSGAAALAARSPVIVDIPAVQSAIQPTLQACFANRVICASSTPLEQLAQRYPNAIYLVGQRPYILTQLRNLILEKALYPALVIATPPNWRDDHILVPSLQTLGIPYLALSGRRGNAIAAIAAIDTIAELTWQVYRHEVNSRTVE